MVKDKINSRDTGKVTQRTRQPPSGRANGGGLRIGEMERDTIISHGATDFLRESMMERGYKFKVAVCNSSISVAALTALCISFCPNIFARRKTTLED